MSLHIQDPANSDSEYLVDALLDACNGATVGGGAFAFLSSGGVRLFLKDTLFKGFMDRGSFDLVVGVDAITDSNAVTELMAVKEQHPSLAAKVLIPNHPRSIFHPKFAWFDRGDGGVLLTGSGNLTAGGLRWNVEAFAVSELSAEEMAVLRAQWDAFLHRTAGCQFDPSDPRVVARLERNAARRKVLRKAGLDSTTEVEEEVDEAPSELPQLPGAAADEAPADEVPAIGDMTPILIAEIPEGGSRWEQANFSKDTFFNFFGASTAVQRRAYFFHVRDDGTLGEQEVRPAVAVKSHNYRFELRAAKGLDYPAEGRPIGVFARVAARTFVYMFLMPNVPGYREIAQLLSTREVAKPARMRRIEFDAAIVRAAWPDAPIWQRLTV
ncbi:phospholipase D family protein [Cupriavidus pinatubonensis]|uniref:phospholipase D family protein n=1 Tax=Cupriavidus pinatubonensis TaxID=248026 RepID=UPI0011297E3D|nr:phospholipase D family protein [Cupriavidus pinatubonensis]TPQ30931.1 hypothetical protein C2U69_30040 [Cupriavidus pinatubonensis]